jgi:hypothetical protein
MARTKPLRRASLARKRSPIARAVGEPENPEQVPHDFPVAVRERFRQDTDPYGAVRQRRFSVNDSLCLTRYSRDELKAMRRSRWLAPTPR